MLHESRHREQGSGLVVATDMVYSQLKHGEHRGIDNAERSVTYLYHFVRLAPQEREQKEGR